MYEQERPFDYPGSLQGEAEPIVEGEGLNDGGLVEGDIVFYFEGPHVDYRNPLVVVRIDEWPTPQAIVRDAHFDAESPTFKIRVDHLVKKEDSYG